MDRQEPSSHSHFELIAFDLDCGLLGSKSVNSIALSIEQIGERNLVRRPIDVFLQSNVDRVLLHSIINLVVMAKEVKAQLHMLELRHKVQ